jgi:two-component system response regulator YesN
MIQEVAGALGFLNVSYFSFFFKKNAGMSPREYREKNA